MYKKYKLLIPTLILVILVTWTFINSGTIYTLTIQHYVGLIATIISAISFFSYRQYYKYILGATLILGLFNLINYTPAQSTISLNFNSLSIGFQPYSFLLIILTVILAMPKKSDETITQSESATKNSEAEFKEDLERFRKLYSTTSPTDLNEMIKDKRYSAASKEAAKQLLNEISGK